MACNLKKSALYANKSQFEKLTAEPEQLRGKEKRLASCDYAGWDKYDADTELSRIELRDEQRNIEARREQQRLKAERQRTSVATAIQKCMYFYT